MLVTVLTMTFLAQPGLPRAATVRVGCDCAVTGVCTCQVCTCPGGIGRKALLCSIDQDRDGSPFVCRACLALAKTLTDIGTPHELRKNDWPFFAEHGITQFPVLLLQGPDGKILRRHEGTLDQAGLAGFLAGRQPAPQINQVFQPAPSRSTTLFRRRR